MFQMSMLDVLVESRWPIAHLPMRAQARVNMSPRASEAFPSAALLRKVCLGET
jgi:hypothetical protein